MPRLRASSYRESDAPTYRKETGVQEFGYMAVCKLMAKSIKWKHGISPEESLVTITRRRGGVGEWGMT